MVPHHMLIIFSYHADAQLSHVSLPRRPVSAIPHVGNAAKCATYKGCLALYHKNNVATPQSSCIFSMECVNAKS